MGETGNVVCIHRQRPNWPAPSGRAFHEIQIGDQTYWCETDGGAPAMDDVARVLQGVAEDPVPTDNRQSELAQALLLMADRMNAQSDELATMKAAMARLVTEAQSQRG